MYNQGYRLPAPYQKQEQGDCEGVIDDKRYKTKETEATAEHAWGKRQEGTKRKWSRGGRRVQVGTIHVQSPKIQGGSN